MIAMIFAIFEVNPDRLMAFLMTLLAVVAAGVAGYIVSQLLIVLIDWKLFRWKLPQGFYRGTSYLVGLFCAVFAAFILFGNYGTGDGDGRGGTDTPQELTGLGNTNSAEPTQATVPPPLAPPLPTLELKPEELVLRVTVLSGAAVKDERFYLIDDDRTPRTLGEVKEQVAVKRATKTVPFILEIRLAERTDRNNSGVLDLESWGLNEGLRVVLPGSRN